MARSFSADSDRVTFGTLGTFSWTFGTWGAVFYTVSTGLYRFALGLGATTIEHSSLGVDDANSPFYYDGASGFSHEFTTTFAASSWAMLVCTKATGTVLPKAHVYKWTTSVWTHINMDNNCVNDASSDRVIVGNHHNDGTDHHSLKAELAAAFMLPSRVMADGELQRLPEGNWDLLIPTAQRWEFCSGRDQPSTSNLMRSWGPNSLRATSVTGTARSAVRDPPGFRFSRNTRRA